MKAGQRALVVLGLLSILFAVLGLLYNSFYLSVDYSTAFDGFTVPYFYPALYIMSSICILCYLLLLIIGVQFVRGKPQFVTLFFGVLVFEVGYALAIYAMILGFGEASEDLSMSMAAALGVANGGLVFQAYTLFPLWAPPLAFWARSKITTSHVDPIPAEGL